MAPEQLTPGTAAAPRDAGRPRLTGISSHVRHLLHDGWTCVGVAPGAAVDLSTLARLESVWRPAIVPGTVASAMRAEGTLDLDRAPDFDAFDWWYRCTFHATPARTAERQVLCLDGLATLAEVWLNGTHLLSSDNMFLHHEVEVTALLQDDNDLVIRFPSLANALAVRRPRPRWRAKGIEHQQLRWHRTTLIGRMPGWSPPIKAVGPWRDVALETRDILDVVRGDMLPVAEVNGGSVEVSLALRMNAEVTITSAVVHVGEERATLRVAPTLDDIAVLSGVLQVLHAEHWWPHTHGPQPRYSARIELATSNGDVTIEFPPIAFRQVLLDQSADGFALVLNGVPVFCRGSCWTVSDVASLRASDDSYRRLLTLARDAGMNMMRIGGTMIYEADVFYDLCDELGIMVWQDFMFSNMDYPVDDLDFLASVKREAIGTMVRLRRHPSVVVTCGNSEVAQQAAMLGLERKFLSNALFEELLPVWCADAMPGAHYWPSSPSGGALPFHVDSGVSHYYGVGAYLRPLDDARRSGVRFTTECLGFANVPSVSALESLLPGGEAAFHHPKWKSRVPRDQSAGWDFDDVRDYYLKELFGLDPMRLRYSDRDRYLAMSRVVTGEAMARTITEWRRPGSVCGGALVWFYRDLWLGAGFGIVDSDDAPKAAYYALKRVMQPLLVAISDEGLNGVHIHLVNDHGCEVRGSLVITLLHGEMVVGDNAPTRVTIPPRAAITCRADELLGRFHDTAYAYRFGPPGFDVFAVTVRDENDTVVGEAFHFPGGIPSARGNDAAVTGVARRNGPHTISIELYANRFAQYVALECGAFVPVDNYFHMMPGTSRLLVAHSRGADAHFDGYVEALNAQQGSRVVLDTGAREVTHHSPPVWRV